MIPGEVFAATGDIVLNKTELPSLLRLQTLATGRYKLAAITTSLRQTLLSDLIGKAALRYRLDIPAGIAVRFEPGQSRDFSRCLRRGALCLRLTQVSHGSLAERAREVIKNA